MELEIYQDQNGNEPFLDWISAIKDKGTAARIRSRLRRIEESGNLGDHRAVGDGVFELRLQFGPGYRIYFGIIKNVTVLLLRGGDKGSQRKDITKAKVDWKEHKSEELEDAQL